MIGKAPPSFGVTQVLEQQQVEAPAQRFILPKFFVGTFPPNATPGAVVTPSVKNVEKWKCANTASTEIHDFLDGQDGQTIKILGDGNTSVDNVHHIRTASGATALMANKVYTFTKFGDFWYEDTHS